MAFAKSILSVTKALRLVLAVCFLVCLKNLAEGGPVNSKKVSEGIVSNIIYCS